MAITPAQVILLHVIVTLNLLKYSVINRIKSLLYPLLNWRTSVKLSDFKLMETTMPKGVQVVLDFDKYELSIVQNEMSYGNKKGLYEIAVFKDAVQTELPGVTNEGDTVKGFLTEKDVDSIIKKLYLITGKQPVQI
jgi:hypothetical protein